MFYNSALEHVTLAEGLEEIRANSFTSTDIREINIPASVRKIEELAFYQCN